MSDFHVIYFGDSDAARAYENKIQEVINERLCGLDDLGAAKRMLARIHVLLGHTILEEFIDSNDYDSLVNDIHNIIEGDA